MVEKALEYLEVHGWAAIPRSKSKIPNIQWTELQSRLPTREEIRQWWHEWPRSGIGIITGRLSGIIVLEVDGLEGEAELARRSPLPETVTARSSRGIHYYFRHPGFRVKTKVGVFPQLDSKGDGGYVVAPPSKHHTGFVYKWINAPGSVPLADAPDWWLEALRDKEPDPLPLPAPSLNGYISAIPEPYTRKAVDDESHILATCPRGSRNVQLFATACKLVEFANAGAIEMNDVQGMLEGACEANGLIADDGLRTVRATIKSAIAKVGGKPRQLPPRTESRPIIKGRAARAIVNEEEPPEEDEEPESEDEDTSPYGIQDGRTVFAFSKTDKATRQTVNTHTPVWDGTGHITEEITAEDGRSSFTVQGHTNRGRRFKFEIGSADLSDERKLQAEFVRVAGAQCIVYAGMSKHLRPSIQKFSQTKKHIHRYDRTGWAEGRFLIPGREPDNTVIHLPRKLPYRIDPGADIEQGLAALRSLLKSHHTPVAPVVLAFLFQGPLAGPAGWHNERYGVFISGRTGSLKSSWMQTAMCLYGPDFINDDLLIKFGEGATRNAIMNMATAVYDLPMPIDNYKPTTGGGARDFTNLNHNILEGGEKDRLTRAATLKDTKPIFCWPLYTGEDVPDNDAASLARMLVVPFAWPKGEDNPDLTSAQNLSCHLCAVGAQWLTWLESEEGQQIARTYGGRFLAQRTVWANALRKQRPDIVNVYRVASNLATNEITWQAMCACPILAGIARDFAEVHERGLMEIAGGMGEYTAESLEAHKFLTCLNHCLSNRRVWLVPRTQIIHQEERRSIIGREDEFGVYLNPGDARGAVERYLKDAGQNGLGIGEKTLHKQLEQIDAIASHEAGRLLKQIRTGDGRAQVIHLHRSLFPAIDELSTILGPSVSDSEEANR